MIYFTFISNTYSIKNKLERSVYTLLEEINRTMVHPDNVQDFKVEVIDAINELNEAHPRCHPLHAHWEDHRPYDSQMVKYPDYKLWIGSGVICNFYLYASKREDE